MHAKRAIFLILIFFEFSIANIFSQELANESQLDSLYALRSKLEALLDSVNMEIAELEAIINKSRVKIDTPQTIQIILTTACHMRDKPSASGEIVNFLSKNTQVLVIGYEAGYFNVKVDDEIGYINEMFIPKNKALDILSIYDTSSKQTTIEPKKEAEQTTTKKSQKASSSSAVSKSSSSSDKTIHTGPRGGKYYINSKGKKVYIDKDQKKK